MSAPTGDTGQGTWEALDRESHPPRDELITSFERAIRIRAFELAGRWADVTRFAMRGVPGARDAIHELDELATMAALNYWLERWFPLQIHQALAAGATMSDVEQATGLDTAEVASLWRRWAVGQRDLAPTISRTTEDYDRVAAIIDATGA